MLSAHVAITGCYVEHEVAAEEISDFVELWRTTKALECSCVTHPRLPGGTPARDEAECVESWLETPAAQRYARCLTDVLSSSDDGMAIVECYRPAHEAFLTCAEAVECPSRDGAFCESLTRSGAEELGAERPSVCIYRERLSDLNEEMRRCLAAFD